jgi:hypothetical protein
LNTYVAALDEAVDVAREITGSDDISMMGSCSGGITSTAYFATLGSAGRESRRFRAHAHRGERRQVVSSAETPPAVTRQCT